MWSPLAVVPLSFLLLSPLLVFAGDSEPPGGEFAPKCLIGDPEGDNVWHPEDSFQVPWMEVDLDLPPRERFKSVVRPFKNEIQAVFDVLADFFGIFPVPVWDWIGDWMLHQFEEGRIMQPYRDEIKGIAEEIGVNLGQLAFLNIFYELSRFCTSIVMQTSDNKDLYHVRNLDFGQLFIWNITTQSWGLTDSLKRVTVNINYIRNGTILFKGTTLAGHVGILTGMKPGKFSLSMNSKVEPDYAQVYQWAFGRRPDIHYAMFFERELFEECDDFDCARQKTFTVPLLSGAYFIIGGNSPGQGSVIVRNITSVQFERKLFDPDNDWFVLQTNYDPDKQPLYLDDRRDPGNACMNKMGRNNISPENIFKVLKSKTTLNKTTIHSVIMSVTKGIYMTFIQYCPNPCWSF